MNSFNEVYNKWRKSFVKVAFILTFSTFVMEISMSWYLIKFFPGMIRWSIVPYVLVYIILPFLVNLGLTICGNYWIESEKISEQAKNYISVLILSGICFVFSSVHNVYTVIACSICFPVYITVIFSDYKMTRDVSIISVFLISITVFFAKIDGRKTDELLFVNSSITLFLLFASYLSAKFLIRLEMEKNKLIYESSKKQSELEEMLKYDTLTNLYNISTFHNVIKTTMEKGEFPISLAVIDIDNFKQVNDTFGHEQGNQVLIYLAELLKNHCSSMGHVFRYGGEEFAIVFPSRDDLDTKGIMEDVQNVFANHVFEDLKQSVTFSCGIASCTGLRYHPKDIFEHADKAMYQAKSSGRNKTIIYKKEFT